VVIDNVTASQTNNIPNDALQKNAAPQAMIVGNVHLDKKDQDVYETMWVKTNWLLMKPLLII